MGNETKWKYGTVVQHRLNPQDSMSCIDLLHACGVNTTGMSFASVVHVALSALLQNARERDIIPLREGYEYSAMMAPFKQPTHADKVAIASKIEGNELARAAADFPTSSLSINALADNSPKAKRLLSLISQLEAKQEVDPDNWTEEDQKKLDNLRYEYANR